VNKYDIDFYMLIFKFKIKIARFKGLSKKKHGFSTFLRGCNPVPPNSYRDEAIKSVHFQAAKLKQFLQSRK